MQADDSKRSRDLRALPAPVLLEWLCLAAGIWLTLRYAWLMDDAFVFFRYVDNLLFLGRGLVFNEGEYVEGCSSPAWTLVLIPLRASGVNYWLIVRALGVLSMLLFWLLLLALRRGTQPPGSGPVLNLPLLYLAVLYPVASYFTSGLETPLVQVCAAAFALHVFRPELRLPQVLIGLAPLVRHELVLPLLLVLAWDWISARRFPRLPTAVALATGGGWLLFRVWYYADLLPNTFYLKDGVQLDWGLAYLHDTLLPYGGYALLALLPALALLLIRRRVPIQVARRLVLLGLAAVVTIYVVRIGGDGRHYRYLAFPFCLAVCASAGLVEHGLRACADRLRPALVTGCGLLLGLLCASLYPRQLSAHPLTAGVLEERVGVIRDAQYHRAQPDIGYSPWSSGRETEVYTQQEAAKLYQAYGESVPSESLTLLDEYQRYVRNMRPPRMPPVGIDSWCYRMWKGFNQSWIHKDGLTDAVLSRTAAKPWRPGHFKPEELGYLTLDLKRVRAIHGPRPGAYRAAVEAGAAPEWIVRNLPALELLDQKIHNRHDLLVNLGLACTPVPRIQLD